MGGCLQLLSHTGTTEAKSSSYIQSLKGMYQVACDKENVIQVIPRYCFSFSEFYFGELYFWLFSESTHLMSIFQT